MAGRKKSRTRRTYSPKLKFQAVLEVLTSSKSPGQVARAYGVHANSVGLWRKTVLERGPELFAQDTAVAEYERRIGELERLLGQKEVEIALLKNFLGQSG
jgi:transposase-like protein